VNKRNNVGAVCRQCTPLQTEDQPTSWTSPQWTHYIDADSVREDFARILRCDRGCKLAVGLVRTPIFRKDSGTVNSTIRTSLVRSPKEMLMF